MFIYLEFSYLVIIREITSLTHAHWIEKSIVMWTIPSVLVSTILSVAARAHILYKVLTYALMTYFCVMFSMSVGALGDRHHFLLLFLERFKTKLIKLGAWLCSLNSFIISNGFVFNFWIGYDVIDRSFHLEWRRLGRSILKFLKFSLDEVFE